MQLSTAASVATILLILLIVQTVMACDITVNATSATTTALQSATANGSPGPTLICLGAGTFTGFDTAPLVVNATTGTDRITIRGSGAGATQLQGGLGQRILLVNDAAATLEQLSIVDFDSTDSVVRVSGSAASLALGGVHFANCSARNGSTLVAAAGGADLNVVDSTFTRIGSTATSLHRSGGCVGVEGAGTHGSLTGVAFVSCASGMSGSAVRATHGSAVVARQLRATHCSSGSGGGAVHAGSSASVSLHDSTFTACSAAGPGGAVYVSSAAALSVNNTVFDSNNSTAGAAVAATSATSALSVMHSLFHSHVSAGVTSSVLLIDGGATATIDTSVVVNNNVVAAVDVRGSGSAVSVAGTSISGNSGSDATACSTSGSLSLDADCIVCDNGAGDSVAHDGSCTLAIFTDTSVPCATRCPVGSFSPCVPRFDYLTAGGGDCGAGGSPTHCYDCHICGTDSDECSSGSHNCDSTAACTNTAGSFVCTCPPGTASFSGGTFCVDVDECALDLHDCRPLIEVCNNTFGSYRCDAGTAPFAPLLVSGGNTTAEANETSVSVVVTLVSYPTADVTVAVSVSDSTEASVAPTSLVFGPGLHWALPRTVTVTGVDDNDLDGDVGYTLNFAPAVSTDTVFAGTRPESLSLTNIDDDVAQLVVVPLTSGSGGSSSSTVLLASTRGGTVYESTPTSPQLYEVTLTARPVANATFPLVANVSGQVVFTPTTLTFTPSLWDTAQTVSVFAVDDEVAEADEAVAVSIGPLTGHSVFDSTAADCFVTVIDDDTAGVAVSGGTYTTEDGRTTSVRVGLTSQPLADVVVFLESTDTTEASLATSSVTLGAANWATGVNVTVVGVDDGEPDGIVAYSVGCTSVVSTDSVYSNMDCRSSSVRLANVDNEASTSLIQVSEPSGNVSEASASDTATFFVVLSRDVGAVSVDVAAATPTEAIVASGESLDFNSAHFAVPQLVTVTGVDDSVADGLQWASFELQLASPTSYSSEFAAVGVWNADNDTAGLAVSPPSGDTTEAGGTAVFTVALRSQPTAGVLVVASSRNCAAGIVPKRASSLAFSPATWSVAQTVTVVGRDDGVNVGGSTAYSIVLSTADSADPGYAGLGDTAASVELNNNQVLVPSIDKLNGPPLSTLAGGWPMTLSGRHFAADARVYVGSKLAENTTVVSSRRLKFVFPPASKAGYYDVSVVNLGGGRDVLADAVFYTDDCPEVGSYGTGSDCSSCPDGAECPGGNRLWPLPGYWTESEDAGYVTACDPAERCLGGRDSDCAPGYRGRLCSRCSEGFYSVGRLCTRCPGPDIMAALITTDVAFRVAAIACLVIASYEFVGVAFRVTLGLQLVWLAGECLLGQGSRVVNTLVRIAGVAAGAPLAPVGCGSATSSFNSEFAHGYLSSLVVGVAATLTVWAAHAVRRRWRRRALATSGASWCCCHTATADVMRGPDGEVVTARDVREGRLRFAVDSNVEIGELQADDAFAHLHFRRYSTPFIVLVLSFARLTWLALRGVYCYKIASGELVLAADSNIECYKGNHKGVAVVSVLSLILVTCGVALAAIRLMIGKGTELWTDIDFLRKYGFLYGDLSSDCHLLNPLWFAVATVLALFSAALYRTTPAPTFVGGTAVLAYCAYVVIRQPMRRLWVTTFYAVCCMLSILFLAEVYVLETSTKNSGTGIVAVDVLAVVGSSTLVVVGLGGSWLESHLASDGGEGGESSCRSSCCCGCGGRVRSGRNDVYRVEEILQTATADASKVLDETLAASALSIFDALSSYDYSEDYYVDDDGTNSIASLAMSELLELSYSTGRPPSALQVEETLRRLSLSRGGGSSQRNGGGSSGSRSRRGSHASSSGYGGRSDQSGRRGGRARSRRGSCVTVEEWSQAVALNQSREAGWNSGRHSARTANDGGRRGSRKRGHGRRHSRSSSIASSVLADAATRHENYGAGLIELDRPVGAVGGAAAARSPNRGARSSRSVKSVGHWLDGDSSSSSENETGSRFTDDDADSLRSFTTTAGSANTSTGHNNNGGYGGGELPGAVFADSTVGGGSGQDDSQKRRRFFALLNSVVSDGPSGEHPNNSHTNFERTYGGTPSRGHRRRRASIAVEPTFDLASQTVGSSPFRPSTGVSASSAPRNPWKTNASSASLAEETGGRRRSADEEFAANVGGVFIPSSAVRSVGGVGPGGGGRGARHPRQRRHSIDIGALPYRANASSPLVGHGAAGSRDADESRTAGVGGRRLSSSTRSGSGADRFYAASPDRLRSPFTSNGAGGDADSAYEGFFGDSPQHGVATNAAAVGGRGRSGSASARGQATNSHMLQNSSSRHRGTASPARSASSGGSLGHRLDRGASRRARSHKHRRPLRNFRSIEALAEEEFVEVDDGADLDRSSGYRLGTSTGGGGTSIGSSGDTHSTPQGGASSRFAIGSKQAAGFTVSAVELLTANGGDSDSDTFDCTGLFSATFDGEGTSVFSHADDSVISHLDSTVGGGGSSSGSSSGVSGDGSRRSGPVDRSSSSIDRISAPSTGRVSALSISVGGRRDNSSATRLGGLTPERNESTPRMLSAHSGSTEIYGDTATVVDDGESPRSSPSSAAALAAAGPEANNTQNDAVGGGEPSSQFEYSVRDRRTRPVSPAVAAAAATVGVGHRVTSQSSSAVPDRSSRGGEGGGKSARRRRGSRSARRPEPAVPTARGGQEPPPSSPVSPMGASLAPPSTPVTGLTPTLITVPASPTTAPSSPQLQAVEYY